LAAPVRGWPDCSYVEPRVITVVGSAISSRMILIGFGVVV
jgi:hypothetical protein